MWSLWRLLGLIEYMLKLTSLQTKNKEMVSYIFLTYTIKRFSKIFGINITIAVQKPGTRKAHDKTLTHRSLALLSCCYELLERVLFNSIGTRIIDNIKTKEACIRPNRNCTDQILSLTTHSEAGFWKSQKTTVVFVDLRYCMKRRVLDKLTKPIPCRETLRGINNIISDRYFQVVTP